MKKIERKNQINPSATQQGRSHAQTEKIHFNFAKRKEQIKI